MSEREVLSQKGLSLPDSPVEESIEEPQSPVKLLTGEQILRVETVPVKEVPEIIPPIEALMRLTNVTREEDIGDNGPVISAIANKGNEGIASLELFQVPFGRDSYDVAFDLEDIYPKLLRSTILFHAQKQGTVDYMFREEQPGRIVHEYREVETDTIGQNISEKESASWEWPYYGEVDATPKHITAICKQCTKEGTGFLDETYTGRDKQEHTIKHSLRSAVDWLLRRLDSNPEGLLEFQPWFKGSIENQVWKDSWDSYSHKDGTIASHENGIASIEVQSLAYDALLDAAEIYSKLGDEELAEDLTRRAANLRKLVLEKFWVEDERGGYFALGTNRDENGNLRRLEVRTSNMGHLLNSKILEGEDEETVRKREAIVTTLFSEEMMAASGIRTLSNREVRFRPGSYHNGSVWFGDNRRIIVGLEKYGYSQEARQLEDKMLAVVEKYKKYPEFARGEDEKEPLLNTQIVDIWDNGTVIRIEQPPQEIQAWTVAAVIAALHKRNRPLTADLSLLNDA